MEGKRKMSLRKIKTVKKITETVMETDENAYAYTHSGTRMIEGVNT